MADTDVPEKYVSILRIYDLLGCDAVALQSDTDVSEKMYIHLQDLWCFGL
jgi:hypothetical protein